MREGEAPADPALANDFQPQIDTNLCLHLLELGYFSPEEVVIFLAVLASAGASLGCRHFP